MRAGYTQADPPAGAITSKALVNGRSNKVVNIASTKMMKIFVTSFRVRSFHERPGMTEC
jgi:hypothetical protein